MVLVLCFVLFQSSSQLLHWDYSKLMLLPKARATAKNGIWSITVLRRTGPLWLSLGLFHTTRFTPDFLITLFIQRGERSCHLEESDYSNKNYTQVPIDSIHPTKTVIHITNTQPFKDRRTFLTCTNSPVVCGFKAGFEYSKSSQVQLKDINLVRQAMRQPPKQEHLEQHIYLAMSEIIQFSLDQTKKGCYILSAP